MTTAIPDEKGVEAVVAQEPVTATAKRALSSPWGSLAAIVGWAVPPARHRARHLVFLGSLGALPLGSPAAAIVQKCWCHHEITPTTVIASTMPGDSIPLAPSDAQAVGPSQPSTPAAPTTFDMRGFLATAATALQALRPFVTAVWAIGVGCISLTLLMGALATQLYEIAHGRDPLPMDGGEFWRSAALRSGGAGVYGDAINLSRNEFGQSLSDLTAGPQMTTAQNVAGELWALGGIGKAAATRPAAASAIRVRFIKSSSRPWVQGAIMRSSPYANLKLKGR